MLPEYVQVDVSGLDIGDSLNVGDIPLPAGVESVDAPDIAIVSVAAPRVAEAAEAVAEEAAAAEPEVIGKKAGEKEES